MNSVILIEGTYIKSITSGHQEIEKLVKLWLIAESNGSQPMAKIDKLTNVTTGKEFGLCQSYMTHLLGWQKSVGTIN